MGDTKKLFSNTAIIFVGSTTASIFSYLFNMLMGRMLGPSQYGEMAAILSLLTIVSVAGGVVTTITMFYVGEMYGLSNMAGIKKIFKIFSKYVFAFAFLLFLLGAALSKPIANFFSIEHVVPVIIAFTSFFCGFSILINKGILQGTQRFVAFSFVSILEMLLRVLIAVIAVKIGYAVSGAIAATVIATAVTYFVTFWPLSKLWQNVPDNVPVQFHFEKKDILAYSAPVFISTLLLIGLLNLDVILVKHYFASDQAGLYSAVSTVSKIILYITSPIISVMFPMILEKKSKGEKHYKMFFFSLLLTAFAALLILVLYTVAPGFVMKVLYGKNFVDYYYLLPQLGVYILFYTLVNLLANYFLAIKNFVFLAFMAVALFLVMILTSLNHTSITVIIRTFTACTALLFLSMIGYYLYIKKDQLRQYLKGEYEQES